MFSTICGKKKLMSQGDRFQGFWNILAHFEVEGGSKFLVRISLKITWFYRVLSVSVVPLVSVESAMESVMLR